MTIVIRSTRYPELGYVQVGKDLWRLVDKQNAHPGGYAACIGPQYCTKAELLADLERMAQQYGCANTIQFCSTVAILDRYADTTDQHEADAYMAAYDRLYGCDSAPYWATRYGDIYDVGVEQMLAHDGH